MKTNFLKTAIICLTIISINIFSTKANGVILSVFNLENDHELGDSPDTTTIKLGKKSIMIIDTDLNDTVIYDHDFSDCDSLDDDDNKFNGHLAGIELGLNNFLNPEGNLTLSKQDEFLKLIPGKSWAFSFNFAEINIGLYKNYIGITTGLGLGINNYRFENDITLFKNNDTLSYFYDTTRNITRNKLTTTYLIMPLLLEFQIPVLKTRLNFAIGGYAGVRVGGHTKQVFEMNSITAKDKVHDGFYTNPWKYGVTARFGGEDIQLFVNYDLSTMFEENRGPKLYPITFGITLLNM